MNRLLSSASLFCAMYLTLLHLSATAAVDKQEWKYIEQYKDLAIREMYRVGIPASITLAQGMLESEYGVSSLSVNANNHFGMKCKSDWSGDTYNHISKNDTQTCFKKYATVYDSYKDHSDHIKSRAWYYFLFILPATDYAGWAVGLQKAGYAADPEYAQKLTAVIERCGLHDLDLTPKPTSPLLNGNDINIAVEKSGNINKSFQERQRANRSNGENIGTDANQGNSDYANEQQPQSPFRNVSIGKSDLNSLNMAIGTGAAPQRAMDGEHLPLSGAPAVTIDAQKIEGSIKRTNTESVVAKPASPIRVGTIQDTPAETQVEYRFEETPALNDRYAAPIHNSDVVAQQSQQQQQQTIIANTTTTQPAVQQRTESNYNRLVTAL